MLLWVDLIVSDFLSHLSVSIPLAGLLIRIHFLWIRIQLFFSIRIRIHSPASVSLPFCLILQTLSLRVSDILSYISVSIPPCLWLSVSSFRLNPSVSLTFCLIFQSLSLRLSQTFCLIFQSLSLRVSDFLSHLSVSIPTTVSDFLSHLSVSILTTVSDFLSHLSVSIPLAWLWIRSHFLRIRIQLFFWLRIRIQQLKKCWSGSTALPRCLCLIVSSFGLHPSVSLTFCLIFQSLSLRLSLTYCLILQSLYLSVSEFLFHFSVSIPLRVHVAYLSFLDHLLVACSTMAPSHPSCVPYSRGGCADL